MTTLRPERPADGPTSYEDTGQFAAVVGQLNDPLNDPLPGQEESPGPERVGPDRVGPDRVGPDRMGQFHTRPDYGEDGYGVPVSGPSDGGRAARRRAAARQGGGGAGGGSGGGHRARGRNGSAPPAGAGPEPAVALSRVEARRAARAAKDSPGVVISRLVGEPFITIGVLRPVPAGSGFTGPGRHLTLTTCTPEFTSTNRLIVWGKLVVERPRSKGKPDALLQ